MIAKIKEAVNKVDISKLEIIELYYLVLLLEELETCSEPEKVLQPEDYCD